MGFNWKYLHDITVFKNRKKIIYSWHNEWYSTIVKCLMDQNWRNRFNRTSKTGSHPDWFHYVLFHSRFYNHKGYRLYVPVGFAGFYTMYCLHFCLFISNCYLQWYMYTANICCVCTWYNEAICVCLCLHVLAIRVYIYCDYSNCLFLFPYSHWDGICIYNMWVC